MSQVREQESVSAGEVYFMPSVGFRVLADFCQKLKDNQLTLGIFDWTGLSLEIRKREDSYNLIVRMERSGGMTSAEFYRRFTMELRDYFGPDLKGWSISSPIWVVE